MQIFTHYAKSQVFVGRSATFNQIAEQNASMTAGTFLSFMKDMGLVPFAINKTKALGLLAGEPRKVGDDACDLVVKEGSPTNHSTITSLAHPQITYGIFLKQLMRTAQQVVAAIRQLPAAPPRKMSPAEGVALMEAQFEQVCAQQAMCWSMYTHCSPPDNVCS